MNTVKESLIQDLKHGDLDSRIEAISRLSDIGTSDIIEIFKRILKDEDEETNVKRYIIESFARFKPSEIIADLLGILENKEEKPILRMAVAYTIGLFEALPVSGLPAIGSDRNISDEIIVSFKKIIEDKLEDRTLRLEVLKTLKQQKAIVSLTAPFFGHLKKPYRDIDVINLLEKIFYDENENEYVRKYAAETLMCIIPHKRA